MNSTYIQIDEVTKEAQLSGIRVRAECACGWHGKWYINGNDAITAQERHHELQYEGKLPKEFRGRNHSVKIIDNSGLTY